MVCLLKANVCVEPTLAEVVISFNNDIGSCAKLRVYVQLLFYVWAREYVSLVVQKRLWYVVVCSFRQVFCGAGDRVDWALSFAGHQCCAISSRVCRIRAYTLRKCFSFVDWTMMPACLQWLVWTEETWWSWKPVIINFSQRLQQHLQNLT